MKRSMVMRFVRPVAVMSTFVVMLGVAFAGDDYNFEAFAYKSGCDSVIFSDRRGQCSSIQNAVNRFCKESPFECKISEFNDTLRDFNSAKGQSANTEQEKKDKAAKILRLWKDLDAYKKKAIYGEPIATECVRNRNTIMDHFTETAKRTEEAGKAQIEVRKGLISKLGDADRRRKEAKEKRDATPNDANLKREYEQAAEAYREAENALANFNEKNGRDIERNYERLVEGYRTGNDKHKEERDAQSNRWNNCTTINRTDIGDEPR